MSIKGKLKQKKPILLSDYQWHDIKLIGQIDENDKLNITEKTSACVYFQQYYYGIDLFDPVAYNDPQAFNEWDFKLKFNGLQYLLIKINSIKDKYKIAYYNLNKN